MKHKSKAHIDNPPENWGPGSDGPVWCPRRKRYDLPLNAVGQQIVENYLTKYHNWPLAPLKKKDSDLHDLAIRLFGVEEADAMARHYVTQAAGKYDPTNFGCSQEGYTYLIHGMWLYFRRYVQVRVDQEAKSREFQALEVDGEMIDFTNAPSREPPVEKSYEKVERVELINRLLTALPPKHRQVIVASFQSGLTMREIARRLGVSSARAWQMYKSAVAKMREASKHTSQTLLDRIDPTRSEECPTDATEAASKPSSAGRKSTRPPSPTSQRERVAKGKRPKRLRSMM